jgi:hypothetical protein
LALLLVAGALTADLALLVVFFVADVAAGNVLSLVALAVDFSAAGVVVLPLVALVAGFAAFAEVAALLLALAGAAAVVLGAVFDADLLDVVLVATPDRPPSFAGALFADPSRSACSA